MLSINGKVLKINSHWLLGSGKPDGLLYLTYLTNNFPATAAKYDEPVVRDLTIPTIRTQRDLSGKYKALSESLVLTSENHLPEAFNGFDGVGIYLGSEGYKDTIDFLWSLPFTGSDTWSFTWRAYYGTDGYIRVHYEEDDDDWYWVNPSVSLVGTNFFGVGDFLSDDYPGKVLCTYKGSPTSTEPVGPVLTNGTTWQEFKDRYYDEPPRGWSPLNPPYGRKFYSYQNPNVTVVNGDRWYYNVIVGHGDGTVSIYVNGVRIINVPFETITKLQFYVGAKRFSTSATNYINQPIHTKITELSLWSKDLSINNRNNVPEKEQPIYKKNSQGIYVPNELY